LQSLKYQVTDSQCIYLPEMSEKFPIYSLLQGDEAQILHIAIIR